MNSSTPKKHKYEKPLARELGSVPMAEGFCVTGGTASLTTCTTGVSTYFCSVGNTPNDSSRDQLCQSGGLAANCLAGADAGG